MRDKTNICTKKKLLCWTMWWLDLTGNCNVSI